MSSIHVVPIGPSRVHILNDISVGSDVSATYSCAFSYTQTAFRAICVGKIRNFILLQCVIFQYYSRLSSRLNLVNLKKNENNTV